MSKEVRVRKTLNTEDPYRRLIGRGPQTKAVTRAGWIFSTLRRRQLKTSTIWKKASSTSGTHGTCCGQVVKSQVWCVPCNVYLTHPQSDELIRTRGCSQPLIIPSSAFLRLLEVSGWVLQRASHPVDLGSAVEDFVLSNNSLHHGAT